MCHHNNFARDQFYREQLEQAQALIQLQVILLYLETFIGAQDIKCYNTAAELQAMGFIGGKDANCFQYYQLNASVTQYNG